MARELVEILLPYKFEIDFPDDLPDEDGISLETPWHRAAIALLIESTRQHRAGRDDYFTGGNMFIYFCRKQAGTWNYRGPDYFFVQGVNGTKERRSWKVWEEDGRYPDVIIELLSPSTAAEDRTEKKDLYAETFRTPEYFMYDPDEQRLECLKLNDGLTYHPAKPDKDGRFWSERLGLWVGLWHGEYLGMDTAWLRFFDEQGQLVPTPAEYERERADALQAELDKLKAQMSKKS